MFVCVTCSKENNSGITWVCNRDNEYTYINEHGKIKCKTGDHIGRYYVYYQHTILEFIELILANDNYLRKVSI